MTVSKDELIQAFSNAKNFKSSDNEATLEGIYVEGPFISEKKAGAQKREFILKANGKFIDALIHCLNRSFLLNNLRYQSYL